MQLEDEQLLIVQRYIELEITIIVITSEQKGYNSVQVSFIGEGNNWLLNQWSVVERSR